MTTHPVMKITCGARLERISRLWMMLMLAPIGCASPPKGYTLYSGPGNDEAEGPWDRFPSVLLSKEELTSNDPSGLLRIGAVKAMADELLRLDGATACDPTSRRPIPNISAEYCSAAYVVNTAQDEQTPTYELRLTVPRRDLLGSESSCHPPRTARDADFPARRTTVIGLLHNHPCGYEPSSSDMRTWPLDHDFTQGMARLDLYPGNAVTGHPPVMDGIPLKAQSYIFAERKGQRIYLLLRTTGDVHQWNGQDWEWRARCEPDPIGKRSSKCTPLFRLIGG